MGTRRKLMVGALGFVAATTTLALWQAAPPPKIERVARRLPMLDSCDGEIHWLSNHEVIVGSTRHTAPTLPRIVDVTTGRERPLPIVPKLTKTGDQVFDDPYRNGPLPSPDGKWLLYEEGITNHEGDRRTGWLLVRSDGSEKRRLPAPTTEKDRVDRKTFWLPDSSGWYVFWCNYRGGPGSDMGYNNWLDKHDFSGKRVWSRQITEEPKGVQADGRLLLPGGSWDVLCRPDFMESCEVASSSMLLPNEVRGASLETEALSYDTKNSFMIFTVKNKPIPDQDFWAVLFNHNFSEAHREFWLVSRDGKQSRCLATDDVSNIPDGGPFWGILSWSPDGKRVLLYGQGGLSMESRVYLLEL